MKYDRDIQSKYDPGVQEKYKKDYGPPDTDTARRTLSQQEENPVGQTSLNDLPSDERDGLQGAGASDISYTSTGKTPKNLRAILSNKKVLGGAAGVGVGGTLVVTLMMGMLPLKLEALTSNITAAASKIPGHAVEQRTEYLVTRALATRVLMAANGGSASEDAGKLVFCGNGSVSCSLFTTFTSEYFEKEMDLDLKKTGTGARLAINAEGRRRLGGAANTWSIDVTEKLDKEGVAKTVQKIENHKEMRLFLKETINQKLKNKSVITRYIARKILMKKYGVKHWRALENTRDAVDKKVDAYRSAFVVGIYKNTIGKISPRLAVYFACFQVGDTCESLLNTLSDSVPAPNQDAVEKAKKESGEGSPAHKEAQARYEKDLKAYESINSLKAKILGEVPDTPPTGFAGTIQKFISKKILAMANAITGAVGLVDILLTTVYSVDKGALDRVGADMVSQTNTGLAFGAPTGVITNFEKVKSGVQDKNIDSGELMNQIGQLLDCDVQAPLCAQENGYLPEPTVASAASGSYSAACYVDGELKTITLEPGELVCPNQRVFRNYTKLFTTNPLFMSLKPLAAAWQASGAAAAVKFINDMAGAAIGTVLEVTQLQKLITGVSEAVLKQAQPAIDALMNYIFDPPAVGFDVAKSFNYVAVSGAVHIEQNELMLNGIEADGTVLGGGGRFLSPAEQLAIVNTQDKAERDTFAQKSWVEKLFNPSLKGSAAQLAILQSPKSAEDVVSLPGRSFASLTRFMPASAAIAPITNPFNLPVSSYPAGDAALSAEPSVYTPEACAASRQARLDSYKKTDTFPVEVYTKTDPCALEKLVTGSLQTSVAVNTGKSLEGSFPSAYQNTSPTTSAPSSGVLGPGDGTCDPRTEKLGSISQRMRGMDNNSVEVRTVTLCALSSIRGANPSAIPNTNGRAVVRAEVSTAWQDMGEAFNALPASERGGFDKLTVGDSFRTNDQQSVRNNGGKSDPNAAAPTGSSRHEQGIAMDIRLGGNGAGPEVGRTCADRQTRDTPVYRWLRANSYKFKIYQYAAEAWHFDTSTSASRCQTP